MAGIREAVANKIATAGPDILEQVVEKIAQETINKRVDLIIRAMSDLDNTERELKRAKPDIVAYDTTGKLVSEAYSKGVIDTRNKLQGRLDKLNKYLEKALGEDQDFGDLNSFLGSNNKPINAKPDEDK